MWNHLFSTKARVVGNYVDMKLTLKSRKNTNAVPSLKRDSPSMTCPSFAEAPTCRKTKVLFRTVTLQQWVTILVHLDILTNILGTS